MSCCSLLLLLSVDTHPRPPFAPCAAARSARPRSSPISHHTARYIAPPCRILSPARNTRRVSSLYTFPYFSASGDHVHTTFNPQSPLQDPSPARQNASRGNPLRHGQLQAARVPDRRHRARHQAHARRCRAKDQEVADDGHDGEARRRQEGNGDQEERRCRKGESSGPQGRGKGRQDRGQDNQEGWQAAQDSHEGMNEMTDSSWSL
ncbi:hypothetical protein Micbo1qcDRAFT_166600, partial [Microdochium bolleyi]